MRQQRAIWFIAAASVALAVGAFGLREIVNGRSLSPQASSRQERDRLIDEMLRALDLDPRVRQADTQRLVAQTAAYSDEPSLSTAETLYALGLRKYYGEFDTAGARDAFERATRAKPSWAWPVNALGIVEYVSGERDAAMARFAEALRMAPGWSRPHADMAILLRRAGDMGAALSHAQAALTIEPEHPINHYNYGVILDELGRHGEARSQYQEAIKISPDLPQALYNLACSFAREGDVDGAVGPLARAIELEPEFRLDAQTDPDFDVVRATAAFESVVAKAAE